MVAQRVVLLPRRARIPSPKLGLLPVRSFCDPPLAVCFLWVLWFRLPHTKNILGGRWAAVICPALCRFPKKLSWHYLTVLVFF